MKHAVLAMLMLLPTPAWAQGDATAEDKQVAAIANRLTAPCCWIQTVATHRSAACDAILLEIRQMLREGKSEAQIMEFYLDKYGEMILAARPVRGFDALVWVLPLGALLVGGVVVVVVARRWSSAPRPAPGAAATAPAERSQDPWRAKVEAELRERL
ncbi:MAG TPA: cytochrome c-type biogenesis protein CcmH [Acidobacteriota bacterium]